MWDSQARPERVVIIGCGAAGLAAAVEIIQTNQAARVLLLTGEKEAPYSRPMLSHILAGEASRAQAFLGLGILESQPRVEFKTNAEVEFIYPRQHQVILKRGLAIHYDKLLIASGSIAVKPPIPGIDSSGVISLMNLADLDKIEKQLSSVRQAVVIGAGLIGLRTAYALKQRGIGVTVVELLDQVMASVLDRRGSELTVELLQSKGIPIRLLTKVTAIEADDKKQVSAILTKDASRLPCDLVLQCTGVRPALECLSQSGIDTERGIAVNEYLQTSCTGIYAAGDCAEPINPVTGQREILATWTQARMQGRVAGKNLCDEKAYCSISIAENAIGFFGVPCVTLGTTTAPEGNGFEETIFERPTVGSYRKLLFHENHIVGAVFYKDLEGSGWINRLIHDKVDISSVKDGILPQSRDYMEFLQELQAEEHKGDVEWHQAQAMKLDYKDRFEGNA